MRGDWALATYNKNFRVKNGLEVGGDGAFEGTVTADSFQLDTTYVTGSVAPGELAWNPDAGTIEFELKDGNIVHRIGQQEVIRVENNTGSTIAQGSVVYISGSSGFLPRISLADASAEATSSKTFGLVASDGGIATGAEGFVVTSGLVRGVNTDGIAAGTALWLSTTAGQYTATKPTAPDHGVFIGWVVKSGTNGEILTKIQNGYELDELHSVLIDGTPADNEVLAYDSTSGLWKNQTAAEAGLIDTSSTAQTKTGAFTSSGIISGLELTSTNSSGSEGGQINLTKPATTSLSGDIAIDIYNNQLRFYDKGGTNRGAYIDLTAAGAGVGTNLLGGVTGAMNYAQTEGTKQSAVSAAGTTIVSVSITTNGYPILVTVTGDVENNSAGGWTVLQLYRDSTAIGNPVHTEGSAGSENVPYALSVIDTPAAGTYTYALKLNNSAGGTFNFGESDGPVITAIELSGPKGDTGASGSTPDAFKTIAVSGQSNVVADSSTDTLTLEAGTNITITTDAASDKITISAASGGTSDSLSPLLLMGG